MLCLSSLEGLYIRNLVAFLQCFFLCESITTLLILKNLYEVAWSYYYIVSMNMLFDVGLLEKIMFDMARSSMPQLN